jgi:hypothetical protein
MGKMGTDTFFRRIEQVEFASGMAEKGCLSPFFARRGRGNPERATPVRSRWSRLRCVFRGSGVTLAAAALLALCTGIARGDAGGDALRAVADAAAALVNDDPTSFFDSFDRDMPDYDVLRRNVEGLLNAYQVGATADVITNEGDNDHRTLTLDWVLGLSGKFLDSSRSETRRRVVKCQVERRGRSWKITSLEPMEFFKP